MVAPISLNVIITLTDMTVNDPKVAWMNELLPAANGAGGNGEKDPGEFWPTLLGGSRETRARTIAVH